ncbi:H/ACA ribonucleoprotein complex subunit Gar1/Naf1 [Carpediemonas membranifera]|uniref:H/ACA ribonucleoprotein complex subunit n=1 Tax=Carpediemonas membranifera TaxID=201153 RepID=A0A8J6AU19_9EUKA|nr:H/ACA ribonucleoprotein complex subunit Gar1/Naf1 [Carpediemonas membranifera]|eukprot:KAG9392450.1 H/ACA ribonucleoprotein complex subunit Gar1/Naf1 [Carpediemonas membranifera]
MSSPSSEYSSSSESDDAEMMGEIGEITHEQIEAMMNAAAEEPCEYVPPPVQDVSSITLPDHIATTCIGTITGIVDGAVMVTNSSAKVFDLSSLLIVQQPDGILVLGKIDDIIGQIEKAIYVIYRSAEEAAAFEVGSEVLAVEGLSTAVNVDVLKQQKFTDASGANDKEKEADFSDDDEERRQRKARRTRRPAAH